MPESKQLFSMDVFPKDVCFFPIHTFQEGPQLAQLESLSKAFDWLDAHIFQSTLFWGTKHAFSQQNIKGVLLMGRRPEGGCVDGRVEASRGSS